MIGLVWKDILVMRRSLKTYALFLAFYLLLAVLGVFDLTFVSAMINVILMMIPIGSFSYDEAAQWDRYLTALPLSRREMVGGKYLFTLVMMGGVVAFDLAASLLLSAANLTDLAENLVTMLICLGVGLLLIDILIPLAYQVGPERARVYLYPVVLVPILLLFGAYKLGWLDGVDLSALNALPVPAVVGLCALVPLAALAGMGISWMISCRIMENKEF